MKFNKLTKLLRAPVSLILAFLMLFAIVGCSAEDIGDGLALAGDVIEIIDDIAGEGVAESTAVQTDTEETESSPIARDGYYYTKQDVALYLHTYGELPPNFITKDEAEDLGWEGGSVEKYLDGAAIGGDIFGNREGLLPKKDGRIYYECDIDTDGAGSRGAKRIVFSNDGLIYYTEDHYTTFELLYGEE